MKKFKVRKSKITRDEAKTVPSTSRLLINVVWLITVVLAIYAIIVAEHAIQDNTLLTKTGSFLGAIESIGKDVILSANRKIVRGSLHHVDASINSTQTQAEPVTIPQEKSNQQGVPNENHHKNKKKTKQVADPDSIPYKEGEFNEGKYIKLMPSKKFGKKQDRRVDLSSIDFPAHKRPPGSPSNIVGYPRAYIEAVDSLKHHPLHAMPTSAVNSLVEAMVYLQNQPQCKNIPIILTMATVKDDLYWQLIENFIYSTVRFGLVECSFVICVSDPHCMELCDLSHFPCFNYHSDQTTSPAPSTMEQIAVMKLLLIPQALMKGVDVFMLDLDVGFLQNPKIMIQAFEESPIMDIMVQEDMIFIMNRTKAGWKTWYTEPLPNIGLFLCRGNERTKKVFEISWKKYQKMEDAKAKVNPGKDQNHVLDAMRYGRAFFDLKYAYFSNQTAMLMDKIFKFQTTLVELGGEVSGDILWKQRTIAMHTTCYEHVTKVLGLKATNAFWHPRYYDPLRPTITKQLLYINTKQLLDEVRSLVWLGLVTNRSIIIPNILGAEKIPNDTIEVFQGQQFWPGFRVLHLKRLNGKSIIPINVLEPAFYWRVERDYDIPPEPHVLSFNPTSESIKDIADRILASGQPRVVLHASQSSHVPPSIVEIGERFRRILDRRRLASDYSNGYYDGQSTESGSADASSTSYGYGYGYDSGDASNAESSYNYDYYYGNDNGESEDTDASSNSYYDYGSQSDPDSISPRGVSVSDSSRGLSRTFDATRVPHHGDSPVDRVVQWAKSSVGLYSRPFSQELVDYGYLPSVKGSRGLPHTDLVLQSMRTCMGIFSRLKGNRSCFQVCD